MTIEITPRVDCKACHGMGTVSAGSVPYGSTWVSLPDDYCGCVIDQLPEDDDDSEIELKLADEVLQSLRDECEAEIEFWARVEKEATPA